MAATGHHPPASNPKRPCWFYGKISGCRYGNGCKYDHSISKTSIYGKLFGILDEILKNQNAIYKAIQQTQNIQFPYNSSTGDVKEEDIQPHQVPRRKIRSKRGKSPPFAAKNPSNSQSIPSNDDSASTSPSPLLRPKQQQKKQQNVRGHPCRETAAMDSGTVCDSEHCVCIEPQRTAVHYSVVPQRKEPQTTASTAVQRPVIPQHKHTPQKKKKSPRHPSRLNPYARAYPTDECKDISTSKKTNPPPQALQILQKRLSHSPPTIEPIRSPKHIAIVPPRTKAQCTVSKPQKQKDNLLSGLQGAFLRNKSKNNKKKKKKKKKKKEKDELRDNSDAFYSHLEEDKWTESDYEANILDISCDDNNINQLIQKYSIFCTEKRIKRQRHPWNFMHFIADTTIIDQDKYELEINTMYRRFTYELPEQSNEIIPIGSQETFTELMLATFDHMDTDDIKIEYNQNRLYSN